MFTRIIDKSVRATSERLKVNLVFLSFVEQVYESNGWLWAFYEQSCIAKNLILNKARSRLKSTWLRGVLIKQRIRFWSSKLLDQVNSNWKSYLTKNSVFYFLHFHAFFYFHDFSLWFYALKLDLFLNLHLIYE